MKKSYLSLLVLAAMSVPAVADSSIEQMFSQGQMKAELRLFDFTRDFDDATTTKHDTSIGGLFYYQTAAVNGISFGTSFASANPIWINDNNNVYGLVARDANGDHEAVNRLQEYFVQGEWWNTRFKLGAQELNTPWMNRHDIRAIPRTYRGFSAINNSVDNLTLSAFYITDSMDWSDNGFVSLDDVVQAKRAGAGTTLEVADNPMYIIGAKYQLPFEQVNAVADVWHYNMQDVFNQTYARLHLSTSVGEGQLYLKPTYLTQASSGDETAGALDTYQYGLHAGAKYAGLNVTLMYAKTGDDALLAPWGDEKAVIQQVYQAGRANEEVYALKVAYDFSKVVNGLSAYVHYGEYDVPEDAGSDFSQTDFSVSYGLDKWLPGLSCRARYALVDMDNGEDLNDLRLYLKYSFVLGNS